MAGPLVRQKSMEKSQERLNTFNALQERYAEFLEAVLWKLTGDKELFAEAMQYSLLQIWQNVDKLQSERAGRYIYRIAQTAAATAWRKRIGRDKHHWIERLAKAKNPSQIVNEKDEMKLARRAISELPPKQGRAIIMRYLEEEDYGTIAKRIGCSEATARSHVSKAMAILKRKLAEQVREELYNG